MDINIFLQQPGLIVGNMVFTIAQVLAAGAVLTALLVLFLAILLIRKFKAQAIADFQAQELIRETQERSREGQERMAELLKSQAEMQGRMQTMAEIFGSRQSEMTQAIRERLDGMTQRIGQNITEQTKSTHDNLAKLQERLAVIDTAQANISSLAGQVVTLQSILSNKQTRGAFGQARMENIIADGLPFGAYEFQATLSSGVRPDCLIRMPNNAPSLAIDAKFPLESWNAIRSAEGEDARKIASDQFRRDIDIHVKAISEKYLIQGETQDTAFLFVPSESVFAQIHEQFEAIVQKAHRARVVIVSPSLLMLSIQVIQAILKDARMREQAHLIQGEVVRLMDDVGRVDERVRKLQMHFQQSAKDVDDILISTAKVTKRGQKIEALEFGEVAIAAEEKETTNVMSRTGQLKLRVVDGDE